MTTQSATKHLIQYLLIASLLLVNSLLYAKEKYTLIIQPIQSPAITLKSYQPLADYLSKATGQTIELKTARNFVSYWQTMRKGQYDLVMDAAHFTGWRIKKLNYKPLAKITSVVSFSLVSHQNNPILEPAELIGKRVAVLPSPSMGAVRLSELFPNAMRQPVIVNVNNSQEAVKKIEQGKAMAAVIPSRMVGAFPFLVTVEQTEQVPHMALSASSKVPVDISKSIQSALLNAKNTPEGRQLLQQLVLESFEAADSAEYAVYADLLQGVFGF